MEDGFFSAPLRDWGAQLGLARSAHDLVRKYPKGKEVMVYHDPENPEESVLEKGVVRETIQMLSFGGIFLIAGLAAIGRGVRRS